MNWILPIDHRWYELIKEGVKEIEGRAPDLLNPAENYRNLKYGDLAIFLPLNESCQRIEGVPEMRFIIGYNKKYDNVGEMLHSEGLENILPGVDSIEEGIKIYHSFPNYKNLIKDNGIHALELKRRLF